MNQNSTTWDLESPSLIRMAIQKKAREGARAALAAFAPKVPKPVAKPVQSAPMAAQEAKTDHGDDKPLVAIPPASRWREIVKEVSAKHGVSLIDMVSERREKRIVLARHEAWFELRRATTMSMPMIAAKFGGKDHTTVLHGIRMHERRLREQAEKTGDVTH